jgi:hypothetical protein
MKDQTVTTPIEGGWVLEKGSTGAPFYMAVIDGLLDWTQDHMKALRLARRADGDALAEIIDDAERVCFHEWG